MVVSWYYMAALICIILRTNVVKYLFRCLLAIKISSFSEMPIQVYCLHSIVSVAFLIERCSIEFKEVRHWIQMKSYASPGQIGDIK